MTLVVIQGYTLSFKSVDILEILKKRFLQKKLQSSLSWAEVEARLKVNKDALKVLEQMEATGGEPAFVWVDEVGKFVFCDCAKESPAPRRSLCYDEEALASRKTAKPKSSACAMAKEIGVELLTKEEYAKLQSKGEFDLKTSSWIKTPKKMRDHGGALFADRRFAEVFFYHNGAESYYASRGFRGVIKI